MVLRFLAGCLLLCASTVQADTFGFARFELVRAGRVVHLHVLQVQDRIEHHHLEAGYVDVWQRDAHGEIFHWKVFPAEGRAVHYTPGDLRTLQRVPDWTRLSAYPTSADGARRLDHVPCTREACRPLELASFRDLEFSDLGDKENDPFVRRFLARFAGHAR